MPTSLAEQLRELSEAQRQLVEEQRKLSQDQSDTNSRTRSIEKNVAEVKDLLVRALDR